MKKAAVALKAWLAREAGLVGVVLLVSAGFLGGTIYGQSSAALTIAKINATHAEEIQHLTAQQSDELKQIQAKFADTIEKKDASARTLINAVSKATDQTLEAAKDSSQDKDRQ